MAAAAAAAAVTVAAAAAAAAVEVAPYRPFLPIQQQRPPSSAAPVATPVAAPPQYGFDGRAARSWKQLTPRTELRWVTVTSRWDTMTLTITLALGAHQLLPP